MPNHSDLLRESVTSVDTDKVRVFDCADRANYREFGCSGYLFEYFGTFRRVTCFTVARIGLSTAFKRRSDD